MFDDDSAVWRDVDRRTMHQLHVQERVVQLCDGMRGAEMPGHSQSARCQGASSSHFSFRSFEPGLFYEPPRS